jgi:hypothetical protein
VTVPVQAAETAAAVKQQHDAKKAAKKERVQQEQRARERGAGPAPARKTDPNGNARFRGEPGSSGGGRGGGRSTSKRRRAVGWAWSGSRKVLTAQFVLCVVILVLGTLTSKDEVKSTAARSMVKGSALALLFFLMALLSSAGGSSARAATAMGTLVTAAYALTSSDVHALVKWLGDYFGKKAPKVGASSGSGDDFTTRWWNSLGDQVAEAEQEAQGRESLTDTGEQ